MILLNRIKYPNMDAADKAFKIATDVRLENLPKLNQGELK